MNYKIRNFTASERLLKTHKGKCSLKSKNGIDMIIGAKSIDIESLFVYGTWELCDVISTTLNFMITDKYDKGFQLIEFTGTQSEIECLLKKFYWEDEITWNNPETLIPIKNLKLTEKSTSKQYVITNVDRKITICSSDLEVKEINKSELYNKFIKLKK